MGAAVGFQFANIVDAELLAVLRELFVRVFNFFGLRRLAG